MKPIPVLGIPYYNRPDLLERCIASIDFPVERLVLVQNGPDEEMPPGPMRHRGPIKELIHIRHPNAGVAGSWNEIIKLFPAPFWMLVNNDIQFAPGDLQKMSAECGVRSAECGILYGNHGASWFAVTRSGIEAVGLFDENFYPAYLEDCDWHYRAKLLNARVFNVQGLKSIHGDGKLTGSCTVNSDQHLCLANMNTHGRNFKYYRAKWGGINGQETFKTPFNEPHWPLQYCHFEPGMRELQWQIWQP